MAPIYGLTGGIASGKSTVARLFAARGAPVLDADQLAREVVAPGQPGLAEVVAAFGREVLDHEGHLDRKRLGAIVFGDDAKRAELERITHPRIAALSMARMGELMQQEVPYALYEAALLVEKGTHKMLAGLIVVAAKPETQLARVMRRDGLDEQAAQARMNAQMPLEAKIREANWVIWNDEDLSALEREVERVHRELLMRA